MHLHSVGENSGPKKFGAILGRVQSFGDLMVEDEDM